MITSRMAPFAALIFLLLGILHGCGGDSSSSSPFFPFSQGDTQASPNTPSNAPTHAAALALTPNAVKTFTFSWSDVEDAGTYRLLENPDGQSGYTQSGADIAPGTEQQDLTVPLYARTQAQYILQSCNGMACTDSASVSVNSQLEKAVGYVKASNTGEFDEFGQAVALSGDGQTLAVGAPLEDSPATGVDGDQGDHATSHAFGAVYIFTLHEGVWSQQAYIKASNSGAGDMFGASLDLSEDGQTLAIGSESEDSAGTGIDNGETDNSASNAGAVYIFTRSNDTWSQQAYIKASNAEAQDAFGSSVALNGDGNTLAVGAHDEDSAARIIDGDEANNDDLRSGAAYIFTRQSNNWSQQAYIKASNTDADDNFGHVVSLSTDGNTLAVSATGEDSTATGIDGDTNNNGDRAGAVYLFSRDTGNWSQSAYIKASNTRTDSNMFGSSISLSGDGLTLAVGADSEDSGATGIDGDESDTSASRAGAVYVFTNNAGTWSQQAYIKASNTDENDRFGAAVDLSGNGDTLAVNAYWEASNATGIGGEQNNNSESYTGAVYVYSRDTGNWSQQAYIKPSNNTPGVNYGQSISLRADGQALAVGSHWEGSSATGVDGDQNDTSASQSGAVYLY